jgi:hypothetical protein
LPLYHREGFGNCAIVSHVERQGHGVPASVVDESRRLLYLIMRTSRHRYGRACGSQPLGEGTPEATSTTSDQGNLASQRTRGLYS